MISILGDFNSNKKINFFKINFESTIWFTVLNFENQIKNIKIKIHDSIPIHEPIW